MSDKRASSSKKHIAYCFSQLVIQQLCPTAMVLTLHGIVCHCVDDGNINRDDILPSCQPLSDKHVDHVQDI